MQDEVAQTTPSRTVRPAAPDVWFAGHHAYVVDVAKQCWESDRFTDVRIHCLDGQLAAHRLVLASCSTFLREAFLSMPAGMPEFTLIIPNIRKQVVGALIHFLYTGKLCLARNAVHDLQKLVSILKIDPDNVRLEIVPDNENKMGTKLVQSKITAMMGPSTTKGSSSAAKSSAKTSVQSTSSEKTPKDVKEKESTSSFATPKLKEPPASSAAPMVAVKSSPTPDGGSLLADRTNRNVSNSSGTRKRNSSGGDSKLKGTGTPSRVTKRKASAEEQLETEPRVETEPRAEVEPRVKMKQIRLLPRSQYDIPGRGGGLLRRRGMRPHSALSGRVHSSGSSSSQEQTSLATKTTGVHDWGNVETWVCALCRQYDPVLPRGVDPEEARDTQWVGCDHCDRWYHQYCTKLEPVDDDFTCQKVGLECLTLASAKSVEEHI